MSEPLLPVEIGPIERMRTLRSFPGWSELSRSELATLAEIARPRLARAGVMVIGRGEPIEASYSVVSGALVARRHGDVLGRYGPGTAVGGLAAFGRDADGYEVQAVRDTTMLEMNIADLEEVFEDRFRILALVLRELARQGLKLRRELLPHAGYPELADGGEACPARSLDLVERIFYLRQNLAIEEDAIDSVAILAKTATELRLGPGEWLWRHGDPSDHMLALLCGRVRCTSPEGHRFELGSGDLAGSLDANAEVPRWYDCQVVDGVVALVLPRNITLDIYEDHAGLARELLRAFSRQVLALQARRGR